MGRGGKGLAGKELTWILRAGKIREQLEAMAAAGQTVPEMADRKPIEGFGWLLEAFMDLHSCRSYTMAGPLPIPWTAIRAYTTAKAMSPDEAHTAEEVVQHLDGIWLEQVRKKSK